jgi:polysaccharide pyruvyl transferase WcaK-like protein
MKHSTRPATILIDGGGFGNKGAEAMLLVVVSALRSMNPQTKIKVRLRPHQFADAKQHGLIPISNAGQNSTTARYVRKLPAALLYLTCHARVDIGGYQFGDPWSVGTAKSAGKLCSYFRRLGKHTLFMPQAWGPFTKPGLESAVARIVENCDCAYVRDRSSLAAIESIVGKNHPHVRSSLDIAWNFPSPDLEIGSKLICSVGLKHPKEIKTICITPNLRVYERASGRGAENSYLRILADLVRHLCAKSDRQVVLLGHALVDRTQSPLDATDDRTLCRLIMEQLPQALPVAHIDEYLSAEQIKSVIGNCHQLISSRYHALIAAFSQNVPAAAIGWSHKYDELMQDVGLTDNILQTDGGWDSMIIAVDRFLDARDDQAQQLRRVLPSIRENARQPIQHMLTMLGGAQI